MKNLVIFYTEESLAWNAKSSSSTALFVVMFTFFIQAMILAGVHYQTNSNMFGDSIISLVSFSFSAVLLAFGFYLENRVSSAARINANHVEKYWVDHARRNEKFLKRWLNGCIALSILNCVAYLFFALLDLNLIF